MAKLLKPMVAVLLVLSIASLVLGYMLFGQREIIKGRTQLLENTTLRVASGLHFDNFQRSHLLTLDSNMSNQLVRLSTHAADTRQNLLDTQQDLENTRLDLEQTQEVLRVTEENLERTRRQVAQLETDLADERAEVARVRRQAEQLERDRASLQARIDDFEIQVAQLEETQLEMADIIAEHEELIAQYEAELFQDEAQIGTPSGLSGAIVLVNSDWNFVVLDVGTAQGLSMNTEMHVHRNDELVGRVRVSIVKDAFAVAEILPAWQQAPLQEGDHVLFF